MIKGTWLCVLVTKLTSASGFVTERESKMQVLYLLVGSLCLSSVPDYEPLRTRAESYSFYVLRVSVGICLPCLLNWKKLYFDTV